MGVHLPVRVAAGAVGAEFSRPSLFRIASAMMERAELPVHRNRTLKGRSMALSLLAVEATWRFRPRARGDIRSDASLFQSTRALCAGAAAL